jgi:PPK2 family polyphosphate:nucleotide phosphotransferase
MNLTQEFIVKPGKKVKLADHDPDYTARFRSKATAAQAVEKNIGRMASLQQLLYAESGHAMLIVFQAMDAGGKDGTIRHVMSGLNPQSCKVTSFKVPTVEEAHHDFLWRIHKAVPAWGEIGIFNRSQYEDVLIVRVHKLVSKSIWSKRYGMINDFERELAQNNTRILKFFLHISKDEQKKRFEERLKDPEKNWKLSQPDFEERKYWDDYQAAYEDALAKCSTDWAPWFVIPADKKWFRNLAVSQIIVEALEDMGLKYPKASFDLSKVVIE